MFVVEDFNKDIECKTLKHSFNVFHEALKDGDKYYHVSNQNGQDYDILYKGNTEWFGDRMPQHVGRVIPEYKTYDEDDIESLDIDFLNFNSQYIVLKLTEYSIAVARVVLKYTDKHVYFMDSRILWFLEENERLHVGEMPIEDENAIYLVGPLGSGYIKGDTPSNKKSDIFVFNSLFFIQYLLNGRKRKDVKYIKLPLDNSSSGLSGLLISISGITIFAKEIGFDVCYNKETIGKFKVSELNKYFKINLYKEDSTKENTIETESVYFFFLTWRYYSLKEVVRTSILQDKFLQDLKEYADATIESRRALGVLIRGTDYKNVGFNGSRSQAAVKDMYPLIKQWMEDGKYDVIFLATEDLDVLKQMREIFKDKLITIAQERHTVDEFKKGQIINDFEKQIYSKEVYDERMMDTSINYFYALYLLSKCEAFMSSGQNNGYDTVVSLNEGKFERVHRFILKEAF